MLHFVSLVEGYCRVIAVSCLLMTVQSLKVAVIGGGAAGLAAARVLSRNGIKPRLFEKEDNIGGVWRHVSGSKTHPMYRGLRTNLPRELMAFRERPWEKDPGKSYVTHREVCVYLQKYRDEFELDQFIVYRSLVTQLRVVEGSRSQLSTQDEELPLIELEWKIDEEKYAETFDAVCVANGHYAVPSIPVLPGIEHFKGRTLHSIEYDDPEEFRGQTVLCIGGRASGADLAREISEVADQVYLSSATEDKVDTHKNVTLVPRTKSINSDGTAQFDHNCDITAIFDTIIYCTGYDYNFPFVNAESKLDLSVAPGERRVTPLYMQLWHALYPNLSFVGLLHSVLPFPLFELQVEAIVAQFRKSILPGLKEREECASVDAIKGGSKSSGNLKDTHYLGAAQWDYCRDLARIAGLYDKEMEDYLSVNQAMYDHSEKERKGLTPGGPDPYRETRYWRIPKAFGVVSSLVSGRRV
mmetsp:Transcript_17341/g.29410  ORF Transcript_17341/g.29410 Transcript_17341/m.29410 type:complete len:468 (-) Transcript_17341:882-2285(-)